MGMSSLSASAASAQLGKTHSYDRSFGRGNFRRSTRSLRLHASPGHIVRTQQQQQNQTVHIHRSARSASTFTLRCSNSSLESLKTPVKTTSGSMCSAPLSPFELELWLHNSVRDIVQHLDNGPFLYLYDSKRGNRIKQLPSFVGQPDKALREWQNVLVSSLQKDKLFDELPQAIIFVNKLPDDIGSRGGVHPAFEASGPVEAGSTCEGEGHSRVADDHTLRDIGQAAMNCGCNEEDCDGDCSETSTWGLTIQGVGTDLVGDREGHACYLLETTKCVCHSVNQQCTKFSLTRARCFEEMSLEEQMLNAWLCHPSLNLI